MSGYIEFELPNGPYCGSCPLRVERDVVTTCNMFSDAILKEAEDYQETFNVFKCEDCLRENR